MTEKTPSQQLYAAISSRDAALVRELVARYPALLGERPVMGMTWLQMAARDATPDVLDALLEAGIDINAVRGGGEETALSFAVMRGTIQVARHLLSRGADPRAGRMLIAAINRKPEQFDFVKLLVEHGADVNQCWTFGDEKKGKIINALSWASLANNGEIVAYLRAHGARLPDETAKEGGDATADEIVTYFASHVGKVAPLSLVPIVPTGQQLQIHVARSSRAAGGMCLFTSGMSAAPMTVPAGGEDCAYAELAIFLPGEWPLSRDALVQKQHVWPVAWLRKIAAYPHQSQIWLGAPIANFSNGDPPKPLAPGCPFTSLLLLADYDGIGPINCSGGRSVRVYTLVPLYPEEQRLERSKGLPELMRRFDKFKIKKIVDVQRKNSGG